MTAPEVITEAPTHLDEASLHRRDAILNAFARKGRRRARRHAGIAAMRRWSR